MAGIVSRHEYFAMAQPPRRNVVLNDSDPARIAVLVAKPFEDPLRGVPLLAWPSFIRRLDPIDERGKRIRYPGGTENASILATVRGSIPKRRAASRRLTRSIRTAKRTRA
jgi:hypothetical protein